MSPNDKLIRLIMGLAKDVKYIPAMGLNSLMISL